MSNRSLKAKNINVYIATNLDNKVTLGEDLFLKGQLSKIFKSVILIDIGDLAERIESDPVAFFETDQIDPSNSVIVYANVAEFQSDEDRQYAIKKTREAHELAKHHGVLFLPTLDPLDTDIGRTGNKGYLTDWNEEILVRKHAASSSGRLAADYCVPPTAFNMQELDRMMTSLGKNMPDKYVVKSVSCEASNFPIHGAKGFHILDRSGAEEMLAHLPEGSHIVQPFIQPYADVSFFFVDGKLVMQQETLPYEPEENGNLYDPASANTDESREERFKKRWETLRVVENPDQEEVQIAATLAKRHNRLWDQGTRRIDFTRDQNGKLSFVSVEPVPSWALDAEGMIVKDMRHPISIIETGKVTREFWLRSFMKPGKMYEVAAAIGESIVKNMNRHLETRQPSAF